MAERLCGPERIKYAAYALDVTADLLRNAVQNPSAGDDRQRELTPEEVVAIQNALRHIRQAATSLNVIHDVGSILEKDT